MKKVRKLLLVVAVILLAGWWLTRGDDRSATVSGTVEQDEARLGTRVSGRLAELGVREGDSVTNGQVLARLEGGEWAARRDYAAAVLAELEAGPRAEDVEAARAAWEAAVADHAFARRESERDEQLMRSKSISETERDRAAARAEVLAKQSVAAEARYRVLSAGTRPEQLAQARARLAEAEIQLAETTVRAPASGIVETIHVKPGDLVGPQLPVATLRFDQPPWVRVYVQATWLGHVRAGHTARVTVDAFPGERWTGRVEQVNRAAEFTPRNVQTPAERVQQVFGVKVRLPADARLQPGMAADVVFEKP